MSPSEDSDAELDSRLRFFTRAIQAGFGGRVLFKLDAHLDALGCDAAFELPGVEYWVLRGTPPHEYPDRLDRLRVNSRRPLSWYRREAPETFIAEWPDGHDEYRIAGDDEERFLAVTFDPPYQETHVLPTEFSVIEIHVPTEGAVESPEELLADVREQANAHLDDETDRTSEADEDGA